MSVHPPDHAALAAVSDPRKSIYTVNRYGGRWFIAVAALETLHGPDRDALVPLLRAVEAAWGEVRVLQLLCEARTGEEERQSPLGSLLAFLDGYVVDALLRVADWCAGIVVSPAEIDTDAIDGEASAFAHFLAIAGLAASDAAIPPEVGNTVRGVASALDDWYQTFLPILTHVGDLFEGRSPTDKSPAE